MIRGTTPTIRFKVRNFNDIDLIQDIWITLKTPKENISPMKAEKPPITKKLSDGDITIEKVEEIPYISAFFSEAETLALVPPSTEAQMKILFKDGRVYATPIYLVCTTNILNSKIMHKE